MSTMRYLTREEIFSIINNLPKIESSFGDVGEYATRSSFIHLEKLLKRERIYPEAIPILTRLLQDRLRFGSVDPGIPVGINCSTAVGEPTTQMTLNSKRSSGVKKTVTESFSRVVELTNVSETKQPQTFISLKTEFPTLADIIDFRIKYVELILGDVIVDYDIISSDEFEIPYWMKMYLYMHNLTFDKNVIHNVLLLNLDPVKLMKHRVRMSRIKEILEENSTMFCVPSPLSESTIVVIPNEQEVSQVVNDLLGSVQTTIQQNEISSHYFNYAAIPEISKLSIKGISGIKDVYPAFYPYSLFVDSEEKVGSLWKLTFDPVKYNMFNVSPGKIKKLYEKTGMKVLSIEDETYVSGKYEYAIPPKIFTISTENVSPSKIFPGLFESEELVNGRWKVKLEKGKEFEYKGYDGDTLQIEESPKIILEKLLGDDAKYVYVETLGANTSELIILPDVDPRHLHTNCIRDTFSNFGIEATRSVFINELLQVMATSGMYLNSKHVTLLTDMMSNLGFMNKLTITGMVSKRTNPLDTSTFERAALVLSNAAAFNKTQLADTPSTSVLLGKVAKMGAGLSKSMIDREKYQIMIDQLKAKKNASSITSIDIRDALKAKTEELSRPLQLNFEPLDRVPELVDFLGKVSERKDEPSISEEEPTVEVPIASMATYNQLQNFKGGRKRVWRPQVSTSESSVEHIQEAPPVEESSAEGIVGPIIYPK